MKKLVILGAGNAFWEISELIKDINKIKPQFKIIAVLDDNVELINKKLDQFEVKGSIDKAKEFPADVQFIFAIGSYKTRLIRKTILDRLKLPENRFETLIHPSAKVFSTAKISSGCIVHYGSIIFNHSIVDSFTTISANCVIGVGNIIGKGALLGSNITTTTGVKIGSFSFVGSSCSIAEGKVIGPGAYVGMGSTVFKDISPGSFVLGNPIKVLDKTEVPQKIKVDWEDYIQNKLK
jgi:sugar O-acyltransferase (sialic acid O-acetyltransferase NeuD family)